MDQKTNVSMAIVDGFDDVDSNPDSVIKGRKIKFTLDYEWVTAGGEKIDPDRAFVVIEIIKVEQKWLPGQNVPVKTLILTPGEQFHDIEQLNNTCPRTEWAEKFGEMRGPWQASRIVYLLDPAAMTIFSYPVPIGNHGGSRAVSDLRESTRLARMMDGQNLYPVVTLADTYMPTQFGGRQRPHFEIKGYRSLGSAPGQLDERGPIRQIERVENHGQREPIVEIEEDGDQAQAKSARIGNVPQDGAAKRSRRQSDAKPAKRAGPPTGESVDDSEPDVGGED